MAITIEIEGPQDIPMVRQIITDAFGTSDEAVLVDQLRHDQGWLPALSLVARDSHGTIIGHALCTRARIGAHPAVTLAPVSVHPAYQGTGVGSALVSASIAAATAAGEKIMTVLGHPDYYPRFGFKQASGYGITCHLNAGPDDAKMVISLDNMALPSGEMGFCATLTEAIRSYQPESD